MKNQTLRYYMHDGPAAFRFELAGNLDDEGAQRLAQDWRTASSVIGDRTLIVDMTFLTNVDQGGRALLARWHRAGAQLIAKSQASREMAEAILGEPLPKTAAESDRDARRTWLPFHSSVGLPAHVENTASTSALAENKFADTARFR